MSHFGCSLMQKIDLITIIVVFGLISTAAAEDISPLQFKDLSNKGSLTRSSSNSSAFNKLSLRISIERRQPEEIGLWYSKSASDDCDFRFREMTTADKADAFEAFKAAMDEFEVLHGVRDTFEDIEDKFRDYINKFKLKGEFCFTKAEDTADPEEHSRTYFKRGKASSFFRKFFVPDRIAWNLDASYSNKGIAGEVYLGDYISIRGDVGEHTEAFMMFKVFF